MLAEIDTGVRESYGDVRELLVHFRTRSHGEDIEPALQTTLRKFEHQSGLAATIAMEGHGMPLSPDLQIQVLHIVQEALSNVRKHANASRVTLLVTQQPQWRFEVRDDGVGFDNEGGPDDETHVGLRIMAERAERIGATLDVVSTPGRGTSIVLTLPPVPPGAAARGRGGRRGDGALRQRISMPAVRILVVDDHTLFRRGLTALLARDPRVEVVGDAADAGEALRRARELAPDVILLDNHLPGVNGVDALPALREAAPAARILMLTVSEDAQDLAAALRGGACGYLLKTIEGDALVAAIVRAMRGESVVAEEMTGKLVEAYRDAASPPAATPTPTLSLPASPLGQLSPREQEILRGIARGASNKEIGRELGHRRDDGQDPRAARAAQARRQLARAGRRDRNRARAALILRKRARDFR